jgi:hypothetical protein
VKEGTNKGTTFSRHRKEGALVLNITLMASSLACLSEVGLRTL